MSKLTNKDREKIIELLQQGKSVPEIFKSRLFPSGDKEYIELTKDYQLVYKGKKRKEDIIADTPEAPLQEVRSFNTGNPFEDEWRNMLIFGDNLMALKTIYEDQRGENKYGTKNKMNLPAAETAGYRKTNPLISHILNNFNCPVRRSTSDLSKC